MGRDIGIRLLPSERVWKFCRANGHRVHEVWVREMVWQAIPTTTPSHAVSGPGCPPQPWGRVRQPWHWPKLIPSFSEACLKDSLRSGHRKSEIYVASQTEATDYNLLLYSHSSLYITPLLIHSNLKICHFCTLFLILLNSLTLHVQVFKVSRETLWKSHSHGWAGWPRAQTLGPGSAS